MVSSKPAEVFRQAREVRRLWLLEGVEPRRLAVLASFVAEPLVPYLVVEADAIDCPLEPWIAPFGTSEQLVLNQGFGAAIEGPAIDPSVFFARAIGNNGLGAGKRTV